MRTVDERSPGRAGRDAATAWLTRDAETAWTRGRVVVCRFTEAGTTRGDFVLNAGHTDRAGINLMLTHARGLPCLVLAGHLYDRLALRSFAPSPGRDHPRGPALSSTIEATVGVTNGISAADRARTIAAAIAPEARPADLRQPGHVPVLRAEATGRRGRATPIQAVLGLAAATGSIAAGVVCEVLDERGDLAGANDVAALAAELGVPLLDLGPSAHDDAATPATLAAGR